MPPQRVRPENSKKERNAYSEVNDNVNDMNSDDNTRNTRQKMRTPKTTEAVVQGNVHDEAGVSDNVRLDQGMMSKI